MRQLLRPLRLVREGRAEDERLVADDLGGDGEGGTLDVVQRLAARPRHGLPALRIGTITMTKVTGHRCRRDR